MFSDTGEPIRARDLSAKQHHVTAKQHHVTDPEAIYEVKIQQFAIDSTTTTKRKIYY